MKENKDSRMSGFSLRRGKANTLEPVLFLVILVSVFAVFCAVMGLGNFINTLMNIYHITVVNNRADIMVFLCHCCKREQTV